jgi:hypothetical protein
MAGQVGTSVDRPARRQVGGGLTVVFWVGVAATGFFAVCYGGFCILSYLYRPYANTSVLWLGGVVPLTTWILAVVVKLVGGGFNAVAHWIATALLVGLATYAISGIVWLLG